MNRVVQIAGAGPSGLACAITLARAGRRVIVHEAGRAVGHRFEAALHGVENWSRPEDWTAELRARGVHTSFEHYGVTALDIAGPGLQRRLDLDGRSLFYLVKRGHGPDALEGALAAQAQTLGVEIRYGSRLCKTQADVIATGPHANHTICIESGIHFKTASPDGAIAVVDRNLAPGGYAYVLIHRGQGCLNTVLFREFKRAKVCLSACRSFVESEFGLDISDERPCGGFGAWRAYPELLLQGRPQIGEAAGIQDPLWGFGIRRALDSGFLLAESMLEGHSWQSAWSAHTPVPDRAGIVNRRLWDWTAHTGFRSYMRLFGPKVDVIRRLRSAQTERSLHRLIFPWVSSAAIQKA